MMRPLYLLLITYVTAYEYGHYVEEGAICKKRSGAYGICEHFSKCLSAIIEVRRNGRPEICSFSGIFPIVCCREDDNDWYEQKKKNQEIISPYYAPFDESNLSLKKCRDYHPKNKHVAPYDEESSNIKRYPHMALLGFDYKNKVHWKCAGSLISEEFILTAASCLHARLGTLKHVRLGELDITSTTNDANPQDFGIKKVYTHPNYKSDFYDNIALVQLDKPVKFTSYVKPACLAVTDNLNGTLPEVVGWGLAHAGQTGSQMLRAADFKYVTHKNCNRMYGTSKYLQNGIDNELHICAHGCGDKKEICQNESGGPLQITNFFYEFNNFPEIVGITSFGKGCGISPDVFTKVYPYVPWIEKIVWPGL